jgi:hypothetical protein
VDVENALASLRAFLNSHVAANANAAVDAALNHAVSSYRDQPLMHEIMGFPRTHGVLGLLTVVIGCLAIIQLECDILGSKRF